MKTLVRNPLHIRDRSHDYLLKEHNGKKLKFVYEAYNGVERCNVSIFNGFEWNHVLSMMDLGVTANSAAYIHDNTARKVKADELFQMAEKMVLNILG